MAELSIHAFSSQKKKSKSKFDRIFGEDADRIRREADKMSASASHSKKSGKSTRNSEKKKKR